MRRFFLAAVCAAVPMVLLSVAGAALAQRTTGAAPQLSVLTASLQYLQNDPLLAELKLSPEQAKKLAAHRTTWFDEFNALAAAERRMRGLDLSDANDRKLGEILKPEQLKRLKEITLQQAEQRFGAGRTLRYPEVIDALSLTAEQVTKLQANEKPDDVLTKDQQKAWKDLRGAPFATPLTSSLASAGDIRPETLRYLLVEAVQIDLKLSPAQLVSVGELSGRWQQTGRSSTFGRAPGAGGPGGRGGRPTNPFPARGSTSIEAIERDAQKLLTPEQALRLRQIRFQVEHRASGMVSAFSNPDVVEGLRLTEQQQKDIHSLIESHSKAVATALLAGKGPDETVAALSALKKSSYEKVLAVLTREQQVEWRDMQGKPVAGVVNPPVAPPSPFSSSRLNTASRTVLRTAMDYITDKALQEELKLKEEQAKKLAELRDKLTTDVAKVAGETGRGPVADYSKKLEEIYTAMEKEVAAVLDADQLKRLKQVTLQQIARGASRAGRITAYKDVLAELKLTDEQKRQVEAGIPVAGAGLTTEQEAKWKEMTGEPFAGVLKSPGPSQALRFSSTPSELLYLNAQDVQRELKITDAQKTAFENARKQWTTDMRAAAQLTVEERQKALEAMHAGFDKLMAEQITPAQRDRLRQLVLQEERQRGLAEFLLGTVASKELSLTREQEKKIATAAGDEVRMRGLVTTEMGASGAGIREKLAEMAEAKMMAVLTKEQAKKLESLLGEPWKGSLLADFGVPSGASGSPVRTPLSGFEPPR